MTRHQLPYAATMWLILGLVAFAWAVVIVAVVMAIA